MHKKKRLYGTYVKTQLTNYKIEILSCLHFSQRFSAIHFQKIIFKWSDIQLFALALKIFHITNLLFLLWFSRAFLFWGKREKINIFTTERRGWNINVARPWVTTNSILTNKSHNHKPRSNMDKGIVLNFFYITSKCSLDTHY